MYGSQTCFVMFSCVAEIFSLYTFRPVIPMHVLSVNPIYIPPKLWKNNYPQRIILTPINLKAIESLILETVTWHLAWTCSIVLAIRGCPALEFTGYLSAVVSTVLAL